jgi:hypothetical protein
MIQLQQQLNKIEHEVSDELLLFKSIPSKYYSVENLIQLYGIWKERMSLFDAYTKFNVAIGLTTPLCFLASCLLMLIGQMNFAKLFMSLLPFFSLGFLFFSFWLKHRFESRGELEHLGKEIHQTIDQRLKSKNMEDDLY